MTHKHTERREPSEEGNTSSAGGRHRAAAPMMCLLLSWALGMIGLQNSMGALPIFSMTGSLITARTDHTATLLPNGQVLVAGGFGTTTLASAELYDPAMGSWIATGSLSTARNGHTATLLPNGKVLVAGGSDDTRAELYYPATGTWSTTGSLMKARGGHTATLLATGKVLVAGGASDASAELYDPATGTWSATGSLMTARFGHTATLLPNGQVLVAGGFGTSAILAGAELYDPATGSWSTTGSLKIARESHTATLLPTGQVLVAGGAGTMHNPVTDTPVTSAELYDPAAGNWSATGSLMTARARHTATLLSSGKVLVAGGFDSLNTEDVPDDTTTSAELYDPATGSWSITGSLEIARDSHTATLLPGGQVLVAGGVGIHTSGFGRTSEGILASAELYDSTSTGTLANISTRAFVQTGDNVLIGGFVVSGNTPKQVVIRAIGPSLGAMGVPSPLQDPVLSLHDTTKEIASNDDWQTDPNANLIPPALRPTDSRESAIVITLQPGAYTAMVSGKNETTGVALGEVYDIDGSTGSELINISTRSLVQTGDFVMIGGFIASGTGNSQVLIKAKGPSLTQFGLLNVLADPVLQVFNSNGAIIASNDNWKDTQQTDIQATGNPPTNDLESAILVNLASGSYTAIVTDKNGGTGIGQVEIFKQ